MAANNIQRRVLPPQFPSQKTRAASAMQAGPAGNAEISPSTPPVFDPYKPDIDFVNPAQLRADELSFMNLDKSASEQLDPKLMSEIEALLTPGMDINHLSKPTIERLAKLSRTYDRDLRRYNDRLERREFSAQRNYARVGLNVMTGTSNGVNVTLNHDIISAAWLEKVAIVTGSAVSIAFIAASALLKAALDRREALKHKRIAQIVSTQNQPAIQRDIAATNNRIQHLGKATNSKHKIQQNIVESRHLDTQVYGKSKGHPIVETCKSLSKTRDAMLRPGRVSTDEEEAAEDSFQTLTSLAAKRAIERRHRKQIDYANKFHKIRSCTSFLLAFTGVTLLVGSVFPPMAIAGAALLLTFTAVEAGLVLKAVIGRQMKRHALNEAGKGLGRMVQIGTQINTVFQNDRMQQDIARILDPAKRQKLAALRQQILNTSVLSEKLHCIRSMTILDPAMNYDDLVGNALKAHSSDLFSDEVFFIRSARHLSGKDLFQRVMEETRLKHIIAFDLNVAQKGPTLIQRAVNAAFDTDFGSDPSHGQLIEYSLALYFMEAAADYDLPGFNFLMNLTDRSGSPANIPMLLQHGPKELSKHFGH